MSKVLTYKENSDVYDEITKWSQSLFNHVRSFCFAAYKTCICVGIKTQASTKTLLILEADSQKYPKSKKSKTLVQSTILDAATGKSRKYNQAVIDNKAS